MNNSECLSLGQALLNLFLIVFWAIGVAAATTKGLLATFFALFPPIAWVFASMWFMELL